jgi:hypothetical protein
VVKRRGPPSQGWRTFLRNHAPDIAAMDLFVVPTIGFKLLHGFVIVRKSFVHTQPSAGFTIITSGFEFSVHTGRQPGPGFAGACDRIWRYGAAVHCRAGRGGPFASRQGEIRGETAPADRLALATLYVALMSDLMLTRLGVTAGDLVVEGSLAANPVYAALLAAVRPTQQVFAGSDAAGTARGAAVLAKWPPRNFQPPPLIAVPPRAVEGLHAYRNVWTKAVLER